jgi:hypothetical protein
MAVISIKNKIKSGSLLVGNAPFILGDYEPIQTVTVGSGGAATVTFSSIPSTYQHLQIRYTARQTSSGTTSDTFHTARFNGDTGSNYAYHYLLADGASVYTYGLGSQTSGWFGFTPYSTTNFAMGTNIIDILDYANTSKNKTIRTLGGNDRNGAGSMALVSGLWVNTAAINSIVITATSFNFIENSSFALYGIKG